MTRPLVGATTERAYASLPEFYRDADTVDGSYPLLRYLSLLLDQLDPVAELLERLDFSANADQTTTVGTLTRTASADTYGGDRYGSDTYGGVNSSALTDPAIADAQWLEWLAQLVGIRRPGASADQLRRLLQRPADEWDHGTPRAIADAAREHLTGTQHVEVITRYNGNPFLIGVVTRQDETETASSWGALETQTRKTWAGLAQLGTFAAAKGPSVVAAAERERPAGFRIVPSYAPVAGTADA